MKFLGRIGEPKTVEDKDTAEIRAFRLRAARERSAWTEIAEPVPRGRWLVDAASDRLYTLYRGATFCGPRLEFAYDRSDLAFFVDRDGDVVVLEQVRTPATWSEHVERQVHRKVRA